MADLTNKWYQAIRHSPDHTEDEDEDASTKLPSSSLSSVRINPKT